MFLKPAYSDITVCLHFTVQTGGGAALFAPEIGDIEVEIYFEYRKVAPPRWLNSAKLLFRGGGATGEISLYTAEFRKYSGLKHAI